MLTDHEISSLTNSLNSVIFDFQIFLDHCSLKRSVESMEQTLQELIELTHLETSTKTNENIGTFTSSFSNFH